MDKFTASVVKTDTSNGSQQSWRIIFLPMSFHFARLLFREPIIVRRRIDEAVVDILLGCVALRNGVFHLFNRSAEATVKEGAVWGPSDATDRCKAKQMCASSGRLIGGGEARGVRVFR